MRRIFEQRARIAIYLEAGEAEAAELQAKREGKTAAEWYRDVVRERLNGATVHKDVQRVGGGTSAHEHAIERARELDRAANPEAGSVVADQVDKPRGAAKKVCLHGRAKGEHCWQCGGIAVVKVLVLALLLCGTAQAQDKPKHKIFWAGSAALAGASAYDWKTTSDLIHRGGWEKNASWAIGEHPSNGKIIAYGSLWTGSEIAAFRYTEKSRHWYVRWAGRGYVGWAVAQHIRLGIHNTRIP